MSRLSILMRMFLRSTRFLPALQACVDESAMPIRTRGGQHTSQPQCTVTVTVLTNCDCDSSVCERARLLVQVCSYGSDVDSCLVGAGTVSARTCTCFVRCIRITFPTHHFALLQVRRMRRRCARVPALARLPILLHGPPQNKRAA